MIQDSYNDWSATYDSDKNYTRDLDGEVTRKILQNSSWQSILEIGCGTGKNTVFFSQIAEEVHSLDFSKSMIAQAKQKLSKDNVTFHIADLTKIWPFDAKFAELAVCNLVLEHIENLSFIFSQVSRLLLDKGQFFLCELHPFRQYQGTRANFQRKQTKTIIPAFVHHISDYTKAAHANNLALLDIQEWWHEQDTEKPPRLLSMMFQKN